MKTLLNGTLIIVLLLMAAPGLDAQPGSPVQTIRGRVTDGSTGSPLPGVTVMVMELEPVKGATTDPDGFFILQDVPAGRHAIRFSSIGFETRWVRDLLVTTAREVILDVVLEPSVTELEEVVVRPDVPKNEAINRLAIASTRILSMEEASRYAGGFDDPARLATSFPGVAGSLGDNALVIRGNAPKGLLWRMEGVEIPTPSHFGNLITMGGGGITALSSQMIADSDFYTGAFPAEYGNALSGVFDLNVRNGNNRRHEHTFRAGAIGLDFASEGPLPLQGGSGEAASYLVNYRYSTFSLIGALLPEDADAIRYQNLSWKVNLPTSTGALSLWGLGATDRSGQSPEENPADWIYNQDREDAFSPTRLGAVGIRHRTWLSPMISLSTTLAATGSGLRQDLDRYTDDGASLYPRERIRSESGKLTLKSEADFRFSLHHTNRTGFAMNRVGYNQQIRFSDTPSVPPATISDATGHTWLYQIFTQSQFHRGSITVNGGVHLQHFALTGDTSLEPRAGVRLSAGGNRFSLGYGRHSRTEPLSVYFSHPDNLNLKLTRADHLVAGFSRMLNPDWHLTLELYSQWLSRVPVIPGTSFSLINLELDWLMDEALVGSGAGRNTGVDLILERYFTRGWYVLFSGSLFDSSYRGGDGVWRNTRFNRRLTGSLLGGKEWEFARPGRVRMLSVSGRINALGGKRYTPINEAASLSARDVIHDESRAFSRQESPLFYVDLTVELRTIRRRTTSTWSLQLMNLTGHKEFYGHRYNLRENRVEEERELILIPNLSWQIGF